MGWTRREFLKKLVIGVGGVAVATVAPSALLSAPPKTPSLSTIERARCLLDAQDVPEDTMYINISGQYGHCGY